MPKIVWSMTTSSASLAHALDLVQFSTRMAEHPGGRASGMPGSDKLFAAPCGMHDATHPRGSVVKFSASPLMLSALPERRSLVDEYGSRSDRTSFSTTNATTVTITIPAHWNRASRHNKPVFEERNVLIVEAQREDLGELVSHKAEWPSGSAQEEPWRRGSANETSEEGLQNERE